MIVGVMQPYYFPYIGYWQLINAVDRYVIYDDVNYIKGGWINRNNILVNGRSKYINLQLYRASPNKLISEISLLGDKIYNSKLLKTLDQSYSKAPYYEETIPLIKSIISHDESNLAKYLTKSIKMICEHLGIETEILLSSEIKKNNKLQGQDKITNICEVLNSNVYVNAIGGQALYSKEDFKAKGLQLRFLKSNEIRYKQFGDEFIPNLSIIDVMMFNSLEMISRMLEDYTII